MRFRRGRYFPSLSPASDEYRPHDLYYRPQVKIPTAISPAKYFSVLQDFYLLYSSCVAQINIRDMQINMARESTLIDEKNPHDE
jgi:hypothetical protein